MTASEKKIPLTIQDLNLGPSVYQSDPLPTELMGQMGKSSYIIC